jgi:hypothetical protein
MLRCSSRISRLSVSPLMMLMLNRLRQPIRLSTVDAPVLAGSVVRHSSLTNSCIVAQEDYHH